MALNQYRIGWYQNKKQIPNNLVYTQAKDMYAVVEWLAENETDVGSWFLERFSTSTNTFVGAFCSEDIEQLMLAMINYYALWE